MTPEKEHQTPIDRLDYTGSLEPVIERLCDAYGIGEAHDFSVIGVGYEDCNVTIDTGHDKFVAKIFAKTRSDADIDRYVGIMEHVVGAGVHHPELLHPDADQTVYSDPKAAGIKLVLMRYVDGQTFFGLDRAPNTQERQAVLEQAAKVNGIAYQPPYIVDSWAIPNIQAMYDRTKQYIAPYDLRLVEGVLGKYNAIPTGDLPHCFVHGDFTKANVIKANSDQIYILDFSVANWYPRIQELAVIIANLLHDDRDEASLHDKSDLVATEYGQLNPLTDAEHRYLYDYTLAGVAMEFMGAHQEKFVNGNDTEETEFWFHLGREGLRKALV